MKKLIILFLSFTSLLTAEAFYKEALEVFLDLESKKLKEEGLEIVMQGGKFKEKIENLHVELYLSKKQSKQQVQSILLEESERFLEQFNQSALRDEVLHPPLSSNELEFGISYLDENEKLSHLSLVSGTYIESHFDQENKNYFVKKRLNYQDFYKEAKGPLYRMQYGSSINFIPADSPLEAEALEALVRKFS